MQQRRIIIRAYSIYFTLFFLNFKIHSVLLSRIYIYIYIYIGALPSWVVDRDAADPQGTYVPNINRIALSVAEIQRRKVAQAKYRNISIPYTPNQCIENSPAIPDGVANLCSESKEPLPSYSST